MLPYLLSARLKAAKLARSTYLCYTVITETHAVEMSLISEPLQLMGISNVTNKKYFFRKVIHIHYGSTKTL
jgi:hypothetical protein